VTDKNRGEEPNEEMEAAAEMSEKVEFESKSKLCQKIKD
jgi:hypothetical protein